MTITVCEGKYCICRFPAGMPREGVIYNLKGFFSLTSTNDELSLVCEEKFAPKTDNVENDWKMLKVEGPLDFSLTGVIAMISDPLARNKIPIFVVSTFDTDYFLVKSDKFLDVMNILGEIFEIKR